MYPLLALFTQIYVSLQNESFQSGSSSIKSISQIHLDIQLYIGFKMLISKRSCFFGLASLGPPNLIVTVNYRVENTETSVFVRFSCLLVFALCIFCLIWHNFDMYFKCDSFQHQPHMIRTIVRFYRGKHRNLMSEILSNCLCNFLLFEKIIHCNNELLLILTHMRSLILAGLRGLLRPTRNWLSYSVRSSGCFLCSLQMISVICPCHACQGLENIF